MYHAIDFKTFFGNVKAFVVGYCYLLHMFSNGLFKDQNFIRETVLLSSLHRPNLGFTKLWLNMMFFIILCCVMVIAGDCSNVCIFNFLTNVNTLQYTKSKKYNCLCLYNCLVTLWM